MSNLLEQLKPVTTLAAEYAPLIADAMATEKLAAGIRGFTMNQIKPEKTLAEKL